MNAERNIIIDDVEREDGVFTQGSLDQRGEAKEERHNNLVKKLDPEEARKKKEMKDMLEKHRVKKMNKTARVKHQAKREAEAEAAKFKEELAKGVGRKKKADAARLKEEREQRREDKLTTGVMFKTRKRKGG